MAKYIELKNEAGGKSLVAEGSVSAVEGIMGQTRLYLASGKSIIVDEPHSQTATVLGLGYTFSTADNRTIHSAYSEIELVGSSMTGDADIYLRGGHKFPVSAHVGKTVTAILSELT